jgi:vacuole morphology and inheritance protein 14
MQVDKLVQLLESPIFIHMRLHLLEIEADYHSDLVKSLYGLLMLLPQSAAFRILRDRLASVTSMATAIGRITISGSTADDANAIKPRAKSLHQSLDSTALLAHFDQVQLRHHETKKRGSFMCDVPSPQRCPLTLLAPCRTPREVVAA